MVADLAFVQDRLRREPYVRPEPAAVIGMSNGSIAAMALQLKRPVSAVVSLDGGIGENAGGTYLKERSEDEVSRLVAPLLHLYTADNPHLDLEHLRSYAACDRTLIVVRGMSHGDFLAYPFFEDGPAEGRRGSEWVDRYTLRFLQARLARDRASAAWLQAAPESHGAPPGLLQITRLPPAC